MNRSKQLALPATIQDPAGQRIPATEISILAIASEGIAASFAFSSNEVSSLLYSDYCWNHG